MRIFSKTDIGKTRDMNQDNYYITENNEEPRVFILADGMGGYTGGEIASKMAIESTKEYIQKKWNTVDKSEEKLLELIKKATQYANNLIFEKSKQVEELEEMGTTLDICLIYNNMIYISHVGDSRIYIITDERIEQITIDHTYVEKLVMEGTITREQAKNHPDRHMLINALGSEKEIEPDVFVRRWNIEEKILLCSDGLTNMLSDNEIQEIIINDLVSPEKALVKKANDMGGLDNITVILIKR